MAGGDGDGENLIRCILVMFSGSQNSLQTLSFIASNSTCREQKLALYGLWVIYATLYGTIITCYRFRNQG